MTRRLEYPPGYVRKLVEEYYALRERADTSSPSRVLAICTKADLDRALDRLELKLWEVVLVHGLLGFTQADAAQVLQIKQSTVSKRYRKGLEELTYIINNGE